MAESLMVFKRLLEDNTASASASDATGAGRGQTLGGGGDRSVGGGGARGGARPLRRFREEE